MKPSLDIPIVLPRGVVRRRLVSASVAFSQVYAQDEFGIPLVGFDVSDEFLDGVHESVCVPSGIRVSSGLL